MSGRFGPLCLSQSMCRADQRPELPLPFQRQPDGVLIFFSFFRFVSNRIQRTKESVWCYRWKLYPGKLSYFLINIMHTLSYFTEVLRTLTRVHLINMKMMSKWVEQGKIEITCWGQGKKKIRTLICMWNTRQLLKKNFNFVSEPPGRKSEKWNMILNEQKEKSYQFLTVSSVIPCGGGGGGNANHDIPGTIACFTCCSICETNCSPPPPLPLWYSFWDIFTLLWLI